MIPEVDTIPSAVFQIVLPASHYSLEIQEVPRPGRANVSPCFCAQIHMLELEHHLQCAGFFIRDDDCISGGYKRSLTHRENIIMRKHFLFHLRQEFHQTWSVDEISTTELIAAP